MNIFNDHLNLSNNIYDNAKILKSVELNKQQELVNRNPTTKYYQTLAINLEEQVQYLKRQLNEAEDRGLGVVYQGDVQNQIIAANPGAGNGDPTNPQNIVLYGPTYRWPDPITGSGVGTGINKYFPKGLSPTVRPNPNQYPGGGDNKRYQDDMRRWREALAAYNADHRPTRLLPRLSYELNQGLQQGLNGFNQHEQVQYLKRQLNEYASPPTINPLDQSYPTPAGDGATDVYGNPLSGPNYNFPPNPGLGQGSGGMRDFFPSGLSRTVGPNPSDYPGGDRNKQYLNDRQRWALACMAYDRVHGKPRQSLGAAIIEDPMRVLRRGFLQAMRILPVRR